MHRTPRGREDRRRENNGPCKILNFCGLIGAIESSRGGQLGKERRFTHIQFIKEPRSGGGRKEKGKEPSRSCSLERNYDIPETTSGVEYIWRVSPRPPFFLSSTHPRDEKRHTVSVMDYSSPSSSSSSSLLSLRFLILIVKLQWNWWLASLRPSIPQTWS